MSKTKTKGTYTRKDYKNLLVPVMYIYQAAYEWYGRADIDSVAKAEARLSRGELYKSAKVKEDE